MHKFPDGIQTVLDAITHCAEHNDVKVLLRGDLVLYALTGNHEFLQDHCIDLILSYDADFNTHKLYKCLIQHVIVHKEIENSHNRYHIMSSGYEVRIDLIHQFDPTRLVQTQRFGAFNLDLLFMDLSTETLRHPPEVSDDIQYIKNTHKDSWSFEDVLGFVTWMGILPDAQIDHEQYERLKLMSLGTLKESLDITWEEQIEAILLLRRSGAALRFIAETFADGVTWVFKVLIDYMISMNVAINEDSNIETVFNAKKFDLVDLYNEFFLGDKKTKESADEIHHRLTTILKLLFDSPNLTIPRPYINKIRTMAGGQLGRCCLGSDVGGTPVFFGCGENIEEEECLGFPVNCPQGNNDCLREHPAFTHIPDANWDAIMVQHREWCPDQECPDADSIHCLQQVSSSSLSSSSSEHESSSSSLSSSSESSSSLSSSSLSSSSLSSSSLSSSSLSSSSLSSSSLSSSSSEGGGIVA